MEIAPVTFVMILVRPQIVLRRGELRKEPALQKNDSNVACSENPKKYSQGGVSSLRQAVVGNERRPDVWPLEEFALVLKVAWGMRKGFKIGEVLS